MKSMIRKRGRPKDTQVDFLKMGIIPRKLTRKEAKKITDEIIDSGVKDSGLRFMLAVFKTIETTNTTLTP